MRALDAEERRIVATTNARIDRIPVWVLPFGATLMLVMSYFFAFYDITSIGVALPVVVKVFRLNSVQIALPISLNLFGYVVGAYLFGTVADWLGRRPAYQITLGCLTIGAILTGLSWNDLSLALFRFLTGIGTGAQIALASVIISEFSSAKARGAYIAANVIFAGLGLAAAPFIAIGLVGIPVIGWRLVLALGGLAIIPFVLSITSLPESPRWLVLHGKIEKALAIVEAMEKRAERRVGQVPPVPEVPDEPPAKGFPTAMLFRPPYLARLVVVFAFWFFWYITTYSYLGLEPTILGRLGMSLPTSLTATAVGDIGFVLGPVVAWFLTDKVERKYLLAAAAFLYSIGEAILFVARSVPVVEVGGLVAGFAIMSGGAYGYAYTAEVFPTDARASAMSIGDGIGHLGGVLGPILTVAVLSALGPRLAFAEIALSVFIAAVVMFLGGMRSSGIELTRLASGSTDVGSGSILQA